MMQLLYSDRETADILGISRASVWRRTRDGILPKPIKIGGATRWRLTDIELVIEKAVGALENVAGEAL